MQFKLGLIINPLAGLGGSVALKGSDGAETAQQALALGAEPRANQRAKTALTQLLPHQENIEIFTVNGEMGERTAKELGFNTQVIYHSQSTATRPEDTETAAQMMQQLGVDLILFAGGDGTARNICHAVGDSCPVLGIPAGCKIHSGVYAITPKAAGRVVELLVTGELVSIGEADVMDIDEAAFREGTVRAKRFGEMQVPTELRYVQAVKNGGKESDELVLADIAAYVVAEMDEDETYIMGSGSTVAAVMEEMGLDNTLLGVDVVRDQALIAQDQTAQQLLSLADDKTKLVITLIGGQGHIFGRGNQQLSPNLIKKVGKDNIILIATKSKLKALNGRPLIADTGDEQLDESLAGFIKVITGFNDHVMYAIGHQE
ncbi:ATP-NAD kinase family protein [Pseudoalteromonas sp. Isolate6]|uniref:ATP-NAD kinase family protein n=1 Tax=Pseudoalteromonas sp. Isolate6 TaxID=2908527 RepID=UPI001EFDE194|nr:ATP-NAD kinase family protein [Pseudoalteromonas sp. Isolate6]MCG9760339.1 ATP-NAD kinase family protein [Pseudoalteromonas sp. Isolate6]